MIKRYVSPGNEIGAVVILRRVEPFSKTQATSSVKYSPSCLGQMPSSSSSAFPNLACSYSTNFSRQPFVCVCVHVLFSPIDWKLFDCILFVTFQCPAQTLYIVGAPECLVNDWTNRVPQISHLPQTALSTPNHQPCLPQLGWKQIERPLSKTSDVIVELAQKLKCYGPGGSQPGQDKPHPCVSRVSLVWKRTSSLAPSTWGRLASQTRAGICEPLGCL